MGRRVDSTGKLCGFGFGWGEVCLGDGDTDALLVLADTRHPAAHPPRPQPSSSAPAARTGTGHNPAAGSSFRCWRIRIEVIEVGRQSIHQESMLNIRCFVAASALDEESTNEIKIIVICF